MKITTKTAAIFCATIISYSAGKAQSMTATSDIIDCGQVEYLRPVTAEFEICNNSSHATAVSKVETYCGCTVADFPRDKIAPKQKATVKITYDAKAMGHFNKLIDVFCDKEKTPLTLQMKGMVVREVIDYKGYFAYKMGSLMSDKDNLEFDDVNSGDQPQQVIHVRNAGSEAATPVIMHLPDYLNADVSPSTLPPGRTAEITVTLNSHRLDDMGLTQTKVYLGSHPGEKVSADKEITVSAVLLPKFDDMTEEEKAAAPRIELSAREIAFEDAGNNRKQKKEILITNMGKSDLHINSLQMFTEGISLSLSKQTIRPGEIAKLKISIEPALLQTARSEPRILMITDDPDNSKVVIRISAKAA